MENTASNSRVVILPPPPPPPLSNTSSSGLVSPSATPLPKSPFPISRYISNETTKSIVVYYKDIEPVIQKGPCCGIVALSMASQFFHEKGPIAEDILCWQGIFTLARSWGFSGSGEMFSAYNMAELAESLMGGKASVISDLLEHKRDILSCICGGYPVLMAYDTDKNYEPSMNKGRNAHWALLNGVCFELSEDVSHLDYEIWGDVDNAFRLSSPSEIGKYLDSSTKTWVFAYQGKSRRMALWDFETLLLSNKNMFELTTKYRFENMFLPKGEDPLCELRDKAVLMRLF